MLDIILERQFDPGLTPDEFRAMALEGAGCMPLYRVKWFESLLAGDGRRLICRFAAPDAEAVRKVSGEYKATNKLAWPGTVHDTGREDLANVVVERCFDAPVTVAELQAREDAAAWCLEQHQVTFLRTFFARDGKRMLCLYHAPDAESVRIAQQQAKMPVERVWSCRRFDMADFA